MRVGGDLNVDAFAVRHQQNVTNGRSGIRHGGRWRKGTLCQGLTGRHPEQKRNNRRESPHSSLGFKRRNFARLRRADFAYRDTSMAICQPASALSTCIHRRNRAKEFAPTPAYKSHSRVQPLLSLCRCQARSRSACPKPGQNVLMNSGLLHWTKFLLGGIFLVGNFSFWAWVWKVGPAGHARTHVPMGK